MSPAIGGNKNMEVSQVMGVPPVIIQIIVGFSNRNHPAIGGTPHFRKTKKCFRFSHLCCLNQSIDSGAGVACHACPNRTEKYLRCWHLSIPLRWAKSPHIQALVTCVYGYTVWPYVSCCFIVQCSRQNLFDRARTISCEHPVKSHLVLILASPSKIYSNHHLIQGRPH